MKKLFSFLLVSLLSLGVLSAEQTLSIIKPDGVKGNHIGGIISVFEDAGLHVAALKMMKLSNEDAGRFYGEHRERPFYEDLKTFMSSGPVVVMVLEGENAIQKNRELMGATDPKEAAPGTIRALYASSKTQNAVHGSDSPKSAKEEIAFFFDEDEIFSR